MTPQQQFDIDFTKPIKSWAGHLDKAQAAALALLINPRKVKAKRLPCPDDIHFGCTFPFTVGSLTVLQDIAGRHHPQVLDAACGYGYFSYLAAIAGGNVMGIDINKKAVDEANDEFKQYITGAVKFAHADIFKWSGEYDVIHCRKFMHFLPPSMQVELLQLLYSMLRPGGVMYISANSIHSGDAKRRAFVERRFNAGELNPGYVTFSRTNHAIECRAVPHGKEIKPGILSTAQDGKSQIYMTNMLDHKTFAMHVEEAEIPAQQVEIYYESWNIYVPEIISDPEQIKPDTPYNLFVKIKG